MMKCVVIFLLLGFVLSFVFETGSYYMVNLAFVVLTRLALSSQSSTCLCLTDGGVTASATIPHVGICWTWVFFKVDK